MHLESEDWMSEESADLDLEQLTEQVAEHIIFIVGSATSDPKPAIVQLLRRYLADVQAQEFEVALREQQREERDQQN